MKVKKFFYTNQSSKTALGPGGGEGGGGGHCHWRLYQMRENRGQKCTLNEDFMV